MRTETRVIIIQLRDYAFCIAGPVCGESTVHWRIPLQVKNSAEL